MCWQCEKYPVLDGETGLCSGCYSEVQHRQHVEEELPKAKDAIEALHRLANSAAGEAALRQALEMEHRTNQQLVCRAIVAMLEKWRTDAERGPGWYDARNEASVKFAEAVFQNVPEKLRYFPYL
jgi:hypothetical protein